MTSNRPAALAGAALVFAALATGCGPDEKPPEPAPQTAQPQPKVPKVLPPGGNKME